MGGGRKKVRNVRPKRDEEEVKDRISSLPEDLIHHILSKMDAKDVIQTCLVSTRWRHLWRSLPHLNFDGCHFSIMLKFIKFVSHFLSNRSRHSNISVLNFNSGGRKIDHSFIRKIARYTRNAQKVNITTAGVYSKGDRQLPLSVFNSGSLKELCLNTPLLIATNIDPFSWNLTTLVFSGVSFVSCYEDGSGKSIDYFSNLLNLRHLTLNYCRLLNSIALKIISPRLETLAISSVKVPCEFIVSAPNLTSFNYHDYNYLSHTISSDSFPCIERVIIHLHDEGSNEKAIREIIGLFHKLCNAMFLSLSMDTICLLSSVPELLENQTSPFRNLKLLKIINHNYWWRHPTKYRHAVSYLCNSSPNSTILYECEEYFHDS